MPLDKSLRDHLSDLDKRLSELNAKLMEQGRTLAKKKIPESPADLPSAISSYKKESSEAESKLRDRKAAKKVTRASNSRKVNRPNK